MCKKILFHTGSLAGGGAQRVIVTLLREFSRKRFECTLVLWQQDGVYFDLVPTDVPIIIFPNGTSSRRENVSQLSQIIKNVQPDLVISFLDGANILALETKLLKRCSCPFIISQRNNLSVSLEKNYPYSAWRRFLKKQQMVWLYRRADHIIALSNGVKIDIVNNFSIPDRIVTPIHNPIDITLVQKNAQAQADYPWERGKHQIVLGVGRLIEQKGFADLIKAFAEVRTNIPSKLVILGEGILREELETLIASLNLQEHVYMPGFVDNPWAYMRDADIFVLSSYWEGLGNVIIEAMACGTPIIATDCDFGPSEIITHEQNGLLISVGDIKQMASTINRLLANPTRGCQLGSAGCERAYDFESSKVTRRYESIFEAVLK